MRAIETGNITKIYDNSVRTYELLPRRTYVVEYDQQGGCYLAGHADIRVREKVYGVHEAKVEKVLESFSTFDRSLGVILSGDKGIGKSIFAKLLSERAADRGIPTIIVDACVPGITHFIESIEQECIVLFDEFDKIFRCTNSKDDQAELLSLFDGTAGGKKLFVVTCNEIYGLNDFIVNRPGRFHYHFMFRYPSAEDIREYLTDQLKEEYYGEIDEVVTFSRKINLNYDCLRSIAFELNRGESFSDAIKDLNILNTKLDEYNVFLYFANGTTLHNYRFRTSLFDNSGSNTWASMYDDTGKEVAEVGFDTRFVTYDPLKNEIVIPKAGLELDFSYCEKELTDRYKDLEPLKLTFAKCNMRNLHFMI